MHCGCFSKHGELREGNSENLKHGNGNNDNSDTCGGERKIGTPVLQCNTSNSLNEVRPKVWCDGDKGLFNLEFLRNNISVKVKGEVEV